MKILQILIAFDQLVNTIFGGYADETISSRCWRLQAKQPYKWLRVFIDTLAHPWQRNHCQKAYESEQLRQQQPPELR